MAHLRCLLLPRRALPTAVGTLLSIGLVGCLSSGVRSTGAVLPQTASEFGGNSIRISVSHSCSGTRCEKFSVDFENLNPEPMEIDVSKSELMRAGVKVPLVVKSEPTKTVLVIPPKSSLSETFLPVDKATRQPLSYVMPESVWCSLKVDSECKNPAEGEAKCSGLAKYYHRSYVSTQAWITPSFMVNSKEWVRPEAYYPNAPDFIPKEPAVALVEESDAPGWYFGGGSSVFYKVECDAKCRCREVSKPRSIQTDDRFLPVTK
jgi:hypothetical protein